MKKERLSIGLLLIVTGKYDIFLERLLESLDTHFFPKDDVVIYLFWDKPYYRLRLPARFSVVCVPTKHIPFPFPTLYRYKYFSQASEKINTNYLFYMDVDMLLVGDVDREILPDVLNEELLVSTLHPGFYKGGGAWCDYKGSTAYTPENLRERYYAGGFQGGETNAYINACYEMAKNITTDEQCGIITEWHDEQHWNKYLCTRKPKMLTPEYCMVMNPETRAQYGLLSLNPRIIALEKNHEELRSDGGVK